MADEDEIDVLGDFSFNSCLAQNNQGIPSCSNREDTVHPQWLLDSIANNWYDAKDSNRAKLGPSRKLSGHSSKEKYNDEIHTLWSKTEKEVLVREMAKYGRNIHKISQTIKTKTEAEIQALIEAEYGVHLDTPSFGMDKHEDHEDIPPVVQEEIVTDEVPNVLNIVATGSPTIAVPTKPFRKKNYNTKRKISLLKPDALIDSKKIDLLAISPSEIFYEDDLMVGSTESIGSDLDSMDAVSRNILIEQQKEKMKAVKKIGNHRRKVSRSYERGKARNKSRELLISPQRRQRKDSSMSDEMTKSPKMQIVFSSGQALPVSEGEQVIKIEKKKDFEPESDIEIDIDSDHEGGERKETKQVAKPDDAPVAVPLRKFEPMPKRQKRINLDGGGGYTIMHTETGDLYAIGAEPRKERPPKKQPMQLIQCRLYNADRPAPYSVRMHVSALIGMDAHAHTSRAEVMGLAGGRAAPAAGGRGTAVTLHAYRPAAAAAGRTHCEMDPVSQAAAAEALRALGLSVCAWHHSHPVFPPAPSALDLRTQRALQDALERARAPLLGLITSQHWPPGRAASQYRCIRAEDPDPGDPSATPTGYQFSVKLVPDLTEENLPAFLRELAAILRGSSGGAEHSVDMVNDVCPQAGITYLEKFISSIRHHMHSAGYEEADPVGAQLLQGVRDVFR